MDNNNIQFPLPVLYKNGCQSLVPIEGVEPVAIIVDGFAFMDEDPRKMGFYSAKRHCKSLRFKSYRISLGTRKAWDLLLEKSRGDFNKTAELIGFKPIFFDTPYWFDQKVAEYSFGICGYRRLRSVPSDSLVLYKVRPVIRMK